MIQLPNLQRIEHSGKYKETESNQRLFTLLKLFDQKSRVKNNEHRLRLIRKFFPGFLDGVIKRLQSADIDNENFEEQMLAEDEYLQALIRRDNKISFFAQELDLTKKKLGTTKKELGTTKKELGTTKKELGTAKEELGTTKKELDTTAKKLEREQRLNQEKENDLKTLQIKMAKMLKTNDLSSESFRIEQANRISDKLCHFCLRT